MIDKILDARFRVLSEDATLQEYSQQAQDPTYLPQRLEALLRNPKMGFFLSPAKWLKQRSAWFMGRYTEIFDEMVSSRKKSNTINISK